MASIQLANVPDELVKRLEIAAASRRHDLTDEIVDRLDDSFGSQRVSNRRSPAELALLARQIRGEIEGEWLTPEFIRMAREYGRE
jgi:plasmid stability protein